MATKWQKVSESEFILSPEYLPTDLVATVYYDYYGRYSGRITCVTTGKYITSARPLALATMKTKTAQLANSQSPWINRIRKIETS